MRHVYIHTGEETALPGILFIFYINAVNFPVIFKSSSNVNSSSLGMLTQEALEVEQS